MYLSRRILNPRSRVVLRDLADCHALHVRVMAAFPRVDGADGAARAELGVLYRLEPQSSSARTVLLVQSRVEPDWSILPEGYVLEGGPGFRNPDCKPIDAALRGLGDGAILAFRLRANPAKKIETKTGPDGIRRNGRRVALFREEDQLAWLRRKSDAAGFELLEAKLFEGTLDVRTSAVQKVAGRRSSGQGDKSQAGRGITVGCVLFEGRLRIIDAKEFRKALEQGFGPGKAFGCGLLSVAAVPDESARPALASQSAGQSELSVRRAREDRAG